MNRTIHNIGSSSIIGMMLITSHATLNAQNAVETSVTTKTETSAGTLSELNSDTIIIKSDTSPEPIRYTYSKTTTYVDETGAPVSMAIVKSGLPVTVYYVKDGDNMVVSKVIVRKAITVVPPTPAIEKKKTSTTTTTTEK